MNIVPPKIFISYSHDSKEHMDWVRRFAEKLKTNGINVVLDQWHIRLGSDITIFMESNLEESDRVLVVCTEQYLDKAKNLKGGVGYERMIVTAEIAGDLNTNKFIPIIRSGANDLMPGYLANRKYVDFNIDALFDEKFEELLYELHDVPRFPEPPLGNKPFLSQAGAVDNAVVRDVSLPSEASPLVASKFHWHRAVHEYCGNSLHFVFLRFAKNSIFLPPSIMQNLEESGIADYMILHLYSDWDVLIRIWADRDMFDALKRGLEENTDLRTEKEFLTVSDLVLIRDGYKKPEDVVPYLRTTSMEALEDIQARWAESPHFQSAHQHGLILEDDVRFNNHKIQFYISVLRGKQVTNNMMARLRDFLRSKEYYIDNKSIYRIKDSATLVLIKGQIVPERYYNVYSFLQEITEHLKDAEVETQTMFVAQPEPRRLSNIDFERARVAIGSRIFKERFPDIRKLRLLDQMKLERLFVEIWDKLELDSFKVFENLFEAKIGSSNEKMAVHVSYFSLLEKLLSNRLPNVLMQHYKTHDWQGVLDNIKREESIARDNYKSMTLGELAKIYRRIVLEKSLIDISPLSATEFARLMDEHLPSMRNGLGHRPDLSQWDALFAFWGQFITVYTRLRSELEKPLL